MVAASLADTPSATEKEPDKDGEAPARPTLIDKLYSVEPGQTRKPCAPAAPLVVDGKDLRQFRRTAKVCVCVCVSLHLSLLSRC